MSELTQNMIDEITKLFVELIEKIGEDSYIFEALNCTYWDKIKNDVFNKGDMILCFTIVDYNEQRSLTIDTISCFQIILAALLSKIALNHGISLEVVSGDIITKGGYTEKKCLPYKMNLEIKPLGKDIKVVFTAG